MQEWGTEKLTKRMGDASGGGFCSVMIFIWSQWIYYYNGPQRSAFFSTIVIDIMRINPVLIV